MNGKNLPTIAWSLTTVVSLIAVIAWGQLYEWGLGSLSIYQFFPLLGLLAFSIMWAHYMSAALRIYSGAAKTVLSRYFEITSLVVLATILLHPGLFVWQLYRDGFGLPPGSYKAYLGDQMYIYAMLGVLGLLIFLAYELRRKFETRSWWQYVGYASDIGMLLIIVHSLQLGSHLQEGWFRGLWIIYGVSYLAAVLYMYSKKLTGRGAQEVRTNK